MKTKYSCNDLTNMKFWKKINVSRFSTSDLEIVFGIYKIFDMTMHNNTDKLIC